VEIRVVFRHKRYAQVKTSRLDLGIGLSQPSIYTHEHVVLLNLALPSVQRCHAVYSIRGTNSIACI